MTLPGTTIEEATMSTKSLEGQPCGMKVMPDKWATGVTCYAKSAGRREGGRSTCRSTRAARGDLADVFQGQRLTLRRALNVVLSREFPRSPMARIPLWTLLEVFWTSLSSPPLGLLNAT